VRGNARSCEKAVSIYWAGLRTGAEISTSKNDCFKDDCAKMGRAVRDLGLSWSGET
jgi:hypothetical protein